jgi:N utilization substance protein A
MDLKNLTVLVNHISEEKGLAQEQVLEAVEQSLAAAYKKEFGKKGQVIKAKIEPTTGKVEFWQEKLVVDDSMIYSEQELEKMKAEGSFPQEEEGELAQKKVHFNPERHVMKEEAKGKKLGDILEIKLKTQTDFGRIAAQTAKQVILQKIREAEREQVLKEFRSKEGELLSGAIQRIEGRLIFVDLGKTLGILLREEQVPGEFYRIGQRLKFYCLKVEESPKGPQILLSRAYPKLVSKLFELEVPEIAAGAVEIRAIAREPGSRSKVAVFSHEEGVDPIGAMVGQRGTRVTAVMNELGGEKIDIVEWAEDPASFVGNALSPSRVLNVDIFPRNRAVAVVAEDQLSLAIGREGQNVRLAAKLTGWKIDVRAPGSSSAEASEDKQD